MLVQRRWNLERFFKINIIIFVVIIIGIINKDCSVHVFVRVNEIVGGKSREGQDFQSRTCKFNEVFVNILFG